MEDRLQDKQKLRHIVNTSIKTTMIGSISVFESVFGGLWGMNLPEGVELNEKQRQFLDMWEEARTRVLDLGNNAMKIASKTVNSYNVKKKDFYKEF